MKRVLDGCRVVLLAYALLGSAPVAASGFSDLIAKDPQIQNTLDTIEAVVEAKVTKGESTRGPSGPMMQLLFSSDTIICASWIVLFRQELQRLIIADAGGADVPPGLIRAAQDLLSRVERACQDIIQGTSTTATGPAATPATTPAASDGPSGAPFTPRPGWTITDEICERRCAEQRAAVQRTDWRKFDAQQNERAARERLAAAERELAAAREGLAEAEARDKAAREELARYEAFASKLPPGGGSNSPVNMHLSSSRAAARKAAADLGTARNRVPLREKDVADSGAAVRSAEAARVRADQEAAEAQAALERCLRDCYRQAAAASGAPMTVAKPAAGVPTKGGACAFSPARSVSIGSREKFGYGEAQKSAEVGKAAIGMLGGMLGGRLGGGGPAQVQPASRPSSLASDPVRNKQSFTDAKTGTAIQVGSQYRPDGKLLVSVNVDRAGDKGVVHQVALERLVPLADGGCAPQGMLPSGWLHYEVWEDWWSKIRIQKYESVDGGPWRQTYDSGWNDWGSGSNLLGSGTLRASEIGGTAWGSMGADRAFGGPKAAGALFDAGAPRVVDAPSPERLVIHVTQPGQDPVTTVPFTLYPTYAAGGAIRYSDKEPDLDTALRGIKPAAGAGMPARPAPQ